MTTKQEKRKVEILIGTLNQIATTSGVWLSPDALELIKKHLTEQGKDEVVKLIEAFIKNWSKILNEIKTK